MTDARERIKARARMDEAAARHGLDVKTSTRPPETEGFEPSALRGRIEAPSGRLSTRDRA